MAGAGVGGLPPPPPPPAKRAVVAMGSVARGAIAAAAGATPSSDLEQRRVIRLRSVVCFRWDSRDIK